MQSLLSTQSAKERESKKVSEEILNLLSKPTAKASISCHDFYYPFIVNQYLACEDQNLCCLCKELTIHSVDSVACQYKCIIGSQNQ